MKKFYPGTSADWAGFKLRAVVFSAFLILTGLLNEARAQELVFSNSILESGTAGQDNAVYRFPNVTTDVDALVTINGRSSSLVKLVAMDLTSTGFDKAFQPQVTFNNNTTPSGISDWWMEFAISFVKHNGTAPVAVTKFDLTALDIDGNGDKLNEWVNMYGLQSYSLEASTLLQYSNVFELVNNVSAITGKDFAGPVTNFTGIDTSATVVMATGHYQNVNSFRVRVGGHSTGSTGAADRMYSFWFRNFNYYNPVQSSLPVKLESFTVSLVNRLPRLDWVAASEVNVSHYVIQRSSNGTDFSDAALLFTGGQSQTDVHYSYTDQVTSSSGILYYRLKMVDQDGQFTYSATRLVRLNEGTANAQVQAYPNPVQSQLRITIPASWQQKSVRYEVYAANGQLMKQSLSQVASQTELLDVSNLPEGIYLLRVACNGEQSAQRFIKTR